MESTFQGILRSREIRGEKGVALARLALIAPTYLFYLNLMRFSVSAARYAAVLSTALCAWLATLLYGSFDLQAVLTLVIPQVAAWFRKHHQFP